MCKRIVSLYRLGDDVFALDLLHILAHGPLDLSDFQQLFASDRPVSTGMGANLRAVHWGINTFQKGRLHALLDNRSECCEDPRMRVIRPSEFDAEYPD